MFIYSYFIGCPKLIEKLSGLQIQKWTTIDPPEKILNAINYEKNTIKSSEALKITIIRWLKLPFNPELDQNKVRQVVGKIYREATQKLFFRELTEKHIEKLSENEKISLLFKACVIGELETFKTIYQNLNSPSVIDLYCPDFEGSNYIPLHFAALSSSAKVTEYIIKLDPRALFTPTQKGRLPLHIASRHGHEETLKVLFYEYLKQWAIKPRNMHFIPLEETALNLFFEEYSNLLKSIESIFQKDPFHYTDFVKVLKFIQFHYETLTLWKQHHQDIPPLDDKSLIPNALRMINAILNAWEKDNHPIPPEEIKSNLAFIQENLLSIQQLLNLQSPHSYQICLNEIQSTEQTIQTIFSKLSAKNRSFDLEEDSHTLLAELGIESTDDSVSYHQKFQEMLGRDPKYLQQMGLVEGRDLLLIKVANELEFKEDPQEFINTFIIVISELKEFRENHGMNIELLKKAANNNDERAIQLQYRILRTELLKLYLKQEPDNIIAFLSEHQVETLSELKDKIIGGISFTDLFSLETIITNN